MNGDTRRRIDNARDVLVGKLPDPKSQVEQITLALIYRFMDYMDRQSEEWGGSARFFNNGYEKYAWSNLVDRSIGGYERLDLYTEALIRMTQNPHLPPLFQDIFKNAYLPYRDPETLRLFLTEIDGFPLDHTEDLGDAYEYLLSIMSSQGDAGQFRTPRHIIDFIVKCVDPKKDETILDPACGTAGFLVSAYLHIMEQNAQDGRPGAGLTNDEKAAMVRHFSGYDISPDMVRLALVNMYFHGFQAPSIHEYDTLSSEDRWDDTFDVIMANPPFMTPKGGIKPHKRFSFQANRSEVLFVDYIAEHLSPSGRAGIIVPEGIIFQSANAYKQLRKMLVEDRHLYAVISLPSGVFNPYAGVKTSILLMDRELAKRTDDILFVKVENDGYDLGAQRRPIGKNDLPDALEVVSAWKRHLADASTPFAVEGEKRAHVIPKEKIVASGDFNLSGERYCANTTVENGRWPLVQLGEVCDLMTGGTPSTKHPEYYGGNVRWLVSGDIHQGEISDCGGRITEAGMANSNARLLPTDSVLIALNGQGKTRGTVALLRTPATCNQSLVAMIPHGAGSLSPRFLYYCLRSRYQEIRALTGDNERSGLSMGIIRRLLIPLPPLKVQQQIVAEVDAWQKIVDGARQVIAHYKPAIPIDRAWTIVELGEVVELISGQHIGSDNYSDTEGGMPYITGPSDYGDYHPIITKWTHEPKVMARKGDILITVKGSGIGSLNILNIEEACISRQIMAIRAVGVERVFLYAYLSGMYAHFQDKGKGAAIPGLTRSDLLHLSVPCPPPDVQSQVVAQIDEERKLVEANKRLVEIHEAKIKAKIAEVWGE